MQDLIDEERLGYQAEHESNRLKQLAIDARAFKNTDLYRWIIEQMKDESEGAKGALTVVDPVDVSKIIELQIAVQVCDKAIILLEQLCDFGVGESE